ncbi:CHAT domain-containing protein [Limnobacter parvus]|uniref:CHAT domain-containing protein n=1 Tax=Limnobacter parvus TaxID=2939690 RepID=A0ABT1XHV4_9BURK|nr:CHAT domain-containing protein [Limnobacter parvus]MCR2746857.1 CHAT domain-containing protein [Limnobacter parvus]
MTIAFRAVLLQLALMCVGLGNAPPAHALSLPAQGQMNAFGILVDAPLEKAYSTFVAGDADAALAALNESSETDTAHRKWFGQLLRAEVFMQMGRASDALDILEQTAKSEVQLFGTALLSQAIQGEARIKLEDYGQASQQFSAVAQALENWDLPTSYRETPNVPWLSHRSHAQARAYSGLANLALRNAQFDLAKDWSNRAEAVYSTIHDLAVSSQYQRYFKVHVDNQLGRANNLTVLAASTAVQEPNSQLASQNFQNAEQLYLAAGNPPGLANSLAMQAYVAFETRQYETAIRMGNLSVQLANHLNLPDLIWRAQLLLGKAYLKTGQMDLAENAFRGAQAAVDLVNGSLASDRSKQQFGVGKSEILAHLVDFDVLANNTAQLFEDAERGRARAFVDLLTDAELTLSDDLQTNQMVRSLDVQIRKLRLQHSLQKRSESRLPIAAEIQSLLTQRSALMDKLSAINTEWSAAYSVRYATLAQVQARLAPDEMLVYAVSGRNADDIYLMFVQRAKSSIKHLPKGHLTLNSALLDFTDAIALGNSDLQAKSLKQIKAALELEAWPKASKFYVVPNKQLHFVPWFGLELGQWVSVLPNGSWLLRQGRKTELAPTYLVVGDPDFAGELPQLPGARSEVTRISQQYRVNPLMGRQATAAAIVAQAQKKLSVLHLATHGVFDYRNPLQSALYFSGEAGKGGAQPMTAEDIFKRPVRADLVVLSACETGVGQVLEDNDILGLQRSFYMNGANQVVNTLWPVSDQGVRDFMAVFHSNLSRGVGVALSRAVQASKKAGQPPAVYAAFVLNGYTLHSVAP